MKADLEGMVGELGSQTSGDGQSWAAEEVASVFCLPHAILWPGSSLQAGQALLQRHLLEPTAAWQAGESLCLQAFPPVCASAHRASSENTW